jgi:Tfp pilus assembly protein PilE
MINIFTKNKHGYAIMELLFYIAIFSIVSVVVINAMVTMAKSFKETITQAQFVQSGNIMERMTREIRQAYSVDVTSTSTDLKLNTTGIDTGVEFKFVGSDLQFLENGSSTATGNLNTPNIAVTSLTFTQITTAKGKAVKIFLTVKSINDTSGATQDFYDTIVLRGSYN